MSWAQILVIYGDSSGRMNEATAIYNRELQGSIFLGCKTEEERESKKWKTATQRLTVRFARYI
jgi:hypothetical protein